MVCFSFYYGLKEFQIANNGAKISGLVFLTMALFLTALISFFMSVTKGPGFLEKKFDFISLVDDFL